MERKAAKGPGRQALVATYGAHRPDPLPTMRRGYVGTAAHGRSANYRYYTCWSRVRYGTTAGCDIHRFNADHIETAITTALLDFYTHRGDLIEQAVAEFHGFADDQDMRLNHAGR